MSGLAAHVIDFGAAAPTELTAPLRQVFAEVTRYPLDILEPDALLEEDLGIDSVKLGEVFSVLRERYDLPEKMGLAPEQLSTIGRIAGALSSFLDQRQTAAPASLAPASPAPASAAPASAAPAAAPAPVMAVMPPALSLPGVAPETAARGEDLLAVVSEVFAEVTRYPREILEPAALLEEDLGIDSVKLGEVFSVLRERYDLPEKMGLAPEQLASIARIAEALETFLASSPSVQAPSVQAPAFEAPAVAVQAAAAVALPGNGQRTSGGNGSHVVEPAGYGGNGAGHTLLDGSTLAAASIAPVVARPAASPAASSFAALVPELQPFAGKVAVITGSGHGLGKEIATYLASLGAKVVVNSFHSRDRGIQTADEIVAAGGDAHHIWASVANPEQVDNLFDEVEQHYGGLDFFIGNASNGMLAPLEEITPQHWEKAFRTNIIGLHQSALRARRLMRQRGGGKIITMSSPASHGYVDYFGCMGAVKAAVESLTRSMAIEFAADDIQVNCVSPGPVYGELLDKWPESERLIPQWESNTAYRRLCEGRDVSHFIAYLLSDSVKLFTGSVLVLDGGISSQGW